MKAVVRLRGRYKMTDKMEDTMKLLNLTRVNHCVVIPDEPEYTGMIRKIKDFITWGEINEETLAKMIEKRGRLPGDKRLDKEWLKENDYSNFEELAKDILSGEIKINDLDIKPIFRLSPPSKGLKSIKRIYPKGDLGNRDEKINELLERMI